MAQQLTAHEQPVYKIFSSDYQFSIPRYQRPYSWGKDHALQLLDDLIGANASDSTEPYFLGSLVLVNQGDVLHDVIDGQQRLTTLTILLALLRDLSESPSFAAELGDLVMEPGSQLAGLEPRPRLRLRSQDADFFAKYVQSPAGTTSLLTLTDATAVSEPQRAIRDNANALRARLSEMLDEERRALARLVSTRTYLVVVSTPNLASAYRIFSVMNARGLDLSPTDIFKSRLIGDLPDDTPHAKRWEDAQEALGRDNFTDLFRDIRTIINEDRARRELLKEFPEQVLDPYLSRSNAGSFVDDVVVPYARAFDATLTRDAGPGEAWQGVNHWLRRLSLIDNKDRRPIALWALKHHEDDPAALQHYFKSLERLAASMLLRGEYTTPRIGRYLDLLRELKGGAGPNAESFILDPEEKRLTREALNGEIYRMQTQRARYVLLRLDELLSKSPGATYQHDIISIEHVLPRNPEPTSKWVQDFNEEERQYWTHRLGNLLLLNRRKNSQAGRFDFIDKKARYFATSSGSAVFALTTQVLSYDSWTPDVVAKRQQELTTALCQEWELN
ncbi:DUF262 domain-containing protein [Ornithinimicrobium tianjinense]|uniref:DUF262 domain-containing protein n=1 Tax=Ornithinimicrobium tianjinense TaxID=1195761 RepID=A0A917BEC2_9MICO|nr:DUF262 domain-containing protein [Ornithinimicrobium tianjinense]GGF40058.1 hypothetical protein GCM10011366_04580 [Ornithinimicrobium tianjinense]